mgnify:CR=1 FL=1
MDDREIEKPRLTIVGREIAVDVYQKISLVERVHINAVASGGNDYAVGKDAAVGRVDAGDVRLGSTGGPGGKARRGKGDAGNPAADAAKKLQRANRASPTLSVALFYLAAAAVVVLMPLVLVWLSNL